MNQESSKQDENSSFQDSLSAFTFKACHANLTNLLRCYYDAAAVLSLCQRGRRLYCLVNIDIAKCLFLE